MEEFKKKIRKKLRKIEIISSIKSDSYLSGNYKSTFRGTGYDFKELREYRHGDPVKYIDWKKFSATRETYLKTYEDERERRMYFLVDIGRSMDVGFTQSKRESAAEFTAYLAHSAIANRDRISLLMFDYKIEEILPPSGDNTRVMAFAEKIFLKKGSDQPPDWKSVLEYCLEFLQSGSVLFIISDFRGWDFNSRILNILQKKGDIIGIYLSHIKDIPEKIAKTANNFYNGENVAGYREVLKTEEKYTEKLKADFNRTRFSFLDVSTGDDPVDKLREFFQRRRMMHG